MSDASAADELVIELSKSKVVLLILCSFAFIAAGYWFITMDAATIKEMPIDEPLFIHGLGIASMALACLGGIFAIRKLFDKRPGLVLNSAGIIDNSSGVAAGFIPWSEIRGAEIYEVHRQKMLIVKVRNPEEYIKRGNPAKRWASRIGYKMSGSPIAITSNTLKINFAELLSTFQQYHQKYGQSMKTSA